MIMPALPAQGDTNWYAHYTALHNAIVGGSGTGWPVGSRYVALGDSITIAGEVAADNRQADSYPHYLSLLSGGRILFVRNAGVGGDTTTQMLARFDTDVTPYTPTMVSIMGGQNDIVFGATDAAYRGNIRAIVAKIRAIGAVPLVFTMTPIGSLASTDKLRVMRNNVWLSMYCESEGIICVDAYSAVVDPATDGSYLSTMLGVQDHPNSLGYAAIGTAAWTAVSSLLPQRRPFRVVPTQLDTLNMLSNGLFLTNSTGWSQNWGPSAGSVASSTVTDANMPGGKAFRLTLTGAINANDHATWHQSVSTGFSVGDRIRASCYVNSAGTVGPMLNVVSTGSTGNYRDERRYTYKDITAALLSMEFVVASGTTALDVNLTINTRDSGAGAGTGTADFGGVSLVNLTTNNLLTV